MASAFTSGNLRPWFKDTSRAFAEHCEGTVYLIVDALPDEVSVFLIYAHCNLHG